MPLKLMQYEVYLCAEDGTPPQEGDEPTHVVMVRQADQLMGELEAARHKLPAVSEAPLNHTTVWVWAALVNQKLLDVDYRTFKLQRLYQLQPVKGAGGAPELVTVDPTQPGPAPG